MKPMKRDYLILAVLAGALFVFLVGFEYLFGRDNLIVGIVFALALVVINSLELQNHPWKIGVATLVISVGLGVVSWVAGLGMVLTLVCTCAIAFISTYFLFGDFQSPLYLPVVAGYLYLISAPEPLARIPYRFLALTTGAVVMVLALWIVAVLRKHRGVSHMIDDLIGEVAACATATAGSSELEFAPTPLTTIIEQIGQINRHLYYRPVRSREMSTIAEMRISLVLTLERLATAMDNLRTEGEPTAIERQCFADLAALLEAIQRSSRNHAQWQKEIRPDLEAFSTRYRALVDSPKADTSAALFEVISAFDVLIYQIDTLHHLWAKDDVEHTPVGDTLWARELRDIVRPTSLRLTFALKYALTLTAIVAVGFSVPWSLYTLVAWTAVFLIKPYVEDTNQRSRIRVIGTLMGIVVFSLLLWIAQDGTLLLICGVVFEIVALLLPFNTYSQTIVSTSGALTLVALATSETGLMLSAERFIFVTIGALISIVVTRFLFPYRATVASVDLVERSRHLGYLMLKKILDTRLAYEDTPEYARLNDEAKHHIKGTALALNIIEHQLMLNNHIREYRQIEQFIESQHELVNHLYFFFASFPHIPHEHETIDRAMHRLNTLVARIDAELVRKEGRHTRYGGPEFYALGYSYLDELEGIGRRIDAAFAYIKDEDSKLSLNALGTIVESLKMPFTCDWIIDQLQ